MGKNSKQVKVMLTEEQKEIVESLVGIMGGTEAEVLRTIFLAWLSEKSLISSAIREKSYAEKSRK
jgi:hypothetical protein